MPGTVLVEELRGRVPERVLRLGKLDQLLPIPGGMSRPPRVRPGPEQCASRLKMPRRHHCHVNEDVIYVENESIRPKKRCRLLLTLKYLLPATDGVEHVAGSLPTADKVVVLAATPRLNNDADMFTASLTSLPLFQYFSIICLTFQIFSGCVYEEVSQRLAYVPRVGKYERLELKLI